MKNYPAFYDKHTAFLKGRKNSAKVLTVLDRVVTGLIGALYLTGLVLSVVGVFGAHLPTLLSVGIPPLVTLGVVTLTRMIIPLQRPYMADDPIHPIVQKEKDTPTFPSRHAASAFAIGVSLCSLALWLGIPVLGLGLVLGYLRFLCGFHYPVDLFGGACIGAALGAISFLF